MLYIIYIFPKTQSMEGPIISAEWLNEHMNHPRLVILDTSMERTSLQNGTGEGVLPGSRYFDLKGAFSAFDARYPNTFPDKDQFEAGARALGIGQDSLIVCYDHKGIFSSARVRWMFTYFGHPSVYVLDGGLPGWTKAGYEVEAEYSDVFKNGDFVAKATDRKIVDLSYITSEERESKSLLVDARSAGRFNGSQAEPREGLRSGAIPGSINIPFADLLEEGHLKPRVELEEKMRVCTDSKRKEELVFTCGSGVTACVLGLAYEYITGDNDYAIYDGSWTEYASEIPE